MPEKLKEKFFMKGMMFEMIIAIGTIFFLIILWTALSFPMNTIRTDLKAMIPAKVMNNTVNKTIIENKIDAGYNTFYFSLLFICIIILVYIVKIAQEHQAKYPFGGG